MTPGLRYVHLLVEQENHGDGRGPKNIIIHTGCGLVGPPYGMGELERSKGKLTRHAPKDEVRSTGWDQDVTCPLCKRRSASIRKVMLDREAEAIRKLQESSV